MAKQEVLDALRVIGPMSCYELSKYLGICMSGVRKSVLRLKGEVRIERWDKNRVPRAPSIPVYGLGGEPNAVRPKPKRAAVRSAESKARRKLPVPRGHVATPWDALL